MPDNENSDSLQREGVTPGKLSGQGYIAATGLSLISTGIDTNPFGLVASLLCMWANVKLAKGAGERKNESQELQCIYILASVCYKLGDIVDYKTLATRVTGNLASLVLGAAEGKYTDNGFVHKMIKHRAAISGGISMAGRAGFMATAYQHVIEKPSVATWSMLLSVAILAISDVLYCASKTEHEPPQPQR